MAAAAGGILYDPAGAGAGWVWGAAADEVRLAGVVWIGAAMGGGTVVTEVAVGVAKGGKPAARRAAACMA